MKAESVTRPIFEDPTSDDCESERADEWSEPKGFMFGGMGIPMGRVMGQQYFEAANVLVSVIESNRCEDYKLAHPILFLYRHYVELTLKGLLVWMGTEDPWGHNLLSLCDLFVAAIQKNFNEKVPNWIINRIRELGRIDPKSTAFRYGDELPWSEVYVNLRHLNQAMKALNAAFDSVWKHLDTPYR